jgi:Transposase, Mutator family
MSKDQVSRLCRGLDEQVRSFRERPLEGAYPYLWLDAKVERVREPASNAPDVVDMLNRWRQYITGWVFGRVVGVMSSDGSHM